MEHLLKSLADYSNLILLILNSILVIITGIYAYLTWRMVSEMKKARENQSDAYIIASPVLLGPVYAQVQLENAGPGPAFDIELSISLEPLLHTKEKIWRHPVLLVGKTEHFFIPQGNEGGLDSLQQLGEKHNNLVLSVKWKNIFGHNKSSSSVHNLNKLADGWFNAGNLVEPDDIPKQMQKVTKSLDAIHRDIEGISRDMRLKPIIENLHKTNIKKTKAPSSKKKVTK